ncbi:uncharacterized protein [Eurosta solidaginis]|uniref:uncharacterized protein isoform X1 n=1 Tax=Eurosta solidaginis TaxID=178769 RepID=UPI0035311415
MVKQVPIDVMHLIDLGVMRKFIMRIISNESNYKFRKEAKINISSKLLALRPYITKEFVRKPISLVDIANWKATEFRMFLLYYGIYVFKDEIPGDVYYEFLLLHCACRLLFCPKKFSSNIDLASDILKLFVKNYAAVFGENSINYNVHGLLHIAEDVKELGIPSNYSAYSFENYLQVLKSYVRQPRQILRQISNMVMQEAIVTDSKFSGFKTKDNCINSFYFDGYMLSTQRPNNYCSLKSQDYVEIVEFKDQNSNVIKGKKLLNLNSFFTEPIDSLTLGICTADHAPSPIVEEFYLDDVEYKLMCIPLTDKLLLIPILHTCM